MQLNNLLGKILGFLVIVITLALAPSINTANASITSANLTNIIGVAAVDDFAAPLIVLGLLVMGGIFAIAGVRGQMQGASLKDMLGVIGAVVVAIVGLTFMVTIITYTNTLIDASTGFAVTLYGIIPLLVYLGVIGSVGYLGYKGYRSGKSSKSKKAAYANY